MSNNCISIRGLDEAETNSKSTTRLIRASHIHGSSRIVSKQRIRQNMQALQDYQSYQRGNNLPTLRQRENSKILSALDESKLIDHLFESVSFDHAVDKKMRFEFMRLLLD